MWFVYFAVNDCDTIVDESVELGGEIAIPAKDLPDVGRMAFLKDSQGAVFAVIKLNKLPD